MWFPRSQSRLPEILLCHRQVVYHYRAPYRGGSGERLLDKSDKSSTATSGRVIMPDSVIACDSVNSLREEFTPSKSLAHRRPATDDDARSAAVQRGREGCRCS